MRQTVKRTARNAAKKRTAKELIKATLKAIEEKAPDAQTLVSKTHKALDKAAKTNTVHPNKANRLKSRLQKKLNTATGTSGKKED